MKYFIRFLLGLPSFAVLAVTLCVMPALCWEYWGLTFLLIPMLIASFYLLANFEKQIAVFSKYFLRILKLVYEDAASEDVILEFEDDEDK